MVAVVFSDIADNLTYSVALGDGIKHAERTPYTKVPKCPLWKVAYRPKKRCFGIFLKYIPSDLVEELRRGACTVLALDIVFTKHASLIFNNIVGACGQVVEKEKSKIMFKNKGE